MPPLTKSIQDSWAQSLSLILKISFEFSSLLGGMYNIQDNTPSPSHYNSETSNWSSSNPTSLSASSSSSKNLLLLLLPPLLSSSSFLLRLSTSCPSTISSTSSILSSSSIFLPIVSPYCWQCASNEVDNLRTSVSTWSFTASASDAATPRRRTCALRSCTSSWRHWWGRYELSRWWILSNSSSTSRTLSLDVEGFWTSASKSCHGKREEKRRE